MVDTRFTGWWTERVARAAEHVVATDAGAEVLQIARTRPYPPGRVEIRRADAADLHAVEGDFNAVLAGFWLSHLARADVPAFLDSVHDRLGEGGRVVLFDNRFVDGSSTLLSRSDPAGDTYQTRRLADGREFEVLKNFFTSGEIRGFLDGRASGVELVELRYYWAAAYTVAGRSGRAAR